MRNSKYWDDFNRRINETVKAISNGTTPPVRRVACFITDRCNFRCSYCNSSDTEKSMSKDSFISMLEKYGDTAIVHITGGEPSVVPWLYDFINDNGDKFRFHLTSNSYIMPPSKSIRRLKVSLDSCNSKYWNQLVGRTAFDRVVGNIKESTKNTIVSITYTLTKQNYQNVIEFADFCNREFPDLYAIFFSVYKGFDRRFILTDEDALLFFSKIIPELMPVLNDESAALIKETIDEKRRLMQGVRFEQNRDYCTCYLSMSERVFSPSGNEYTCSHLYRDGIYKKAPSKDTKCLYGCNRRLVAFNEAVSLRLNQEIK